MTLIITNIRFLDTMTMHQAASCRTGATTCHSKATCIDYEIGFCCSCKQGYFGNGKSCQPNGKLFINGNCQKLALRDKFELMACKRGLWSILETGIKKKSFNIPLWTPDNAPSNANKDTQKSSRVGQIDASQ